MKKSKFKLGDKVSFKRNSTIKNSKAIILGVIEKNGDDSMYVIEYADGISPDSRMEQFGLDADKKYIFVAERELSKKLF
jgi:hypothetical protein